MNDLDLLSKYFLGLLSEEEKVVLFEKMEFDDNLKDKFIEAQCNYSLAQMLTHEADVEYSKRHLQELKKRIRINLIRRSVISLSKYAAILLVVVGLFFFFKNYILNSSHESQFVEYISPVGLRKEINLPDGTKVCLAPASRIKVPIKFSKKARLVELDGEALFNVKKSKERPFIVKTNKYDIKVLGTIFAVKAYSGNSLFKTSLLEGSVRVYNDQEEQLLNPGEYVFSENNKLILKNDNTKDIQYLQSGIYEFDEKSLDKILDMLSSWYNVDIAIINPKLSQKLLTGKFRESNNIETILTAIQQIYPFEYSKMSNNLIKIY